MTTNKQASKAAAEVAMAEPTQTAKKAAAAKEATETFFEQVLTVRLTADRKALDIIDQTLLPGQVKRIRLSSKEAIKDAIATLKVRGAPAIGVAAAYGLAVLAAEEYESHFMDSNDEHATDVAESLKTCGVGGADVADKVGADITDAPKAPSAHPISNLSSDTTIGDDASSAMVVAFLQRIHELKEYLAQSRPTAVNLFWALDRMEQAARFAQSAGCKGIVEALYHEADAIREEDVAISLGIGQAGFLLLQEIRDKKRAAGDQSPVGVLTHCNAGTLATAKYGTATAPLYLALEQGWQAHDLHVYCDETRPLLQGARLTSFELSRAGIATTVQCDSAAASLMAAGKVDIIFVGCDRVARNGDVANKIGTSGLAVLAQYYHVPFYVCAPTSTLDMNCPDGSSIVIEQRAAEEVTTQWYTEPMVPGGVEVYNPAFDVTDHALITGIITENGLFQS